MATRIQDKSRPTKRPMVSGTWSTGGAAFSAVTVHARTPRLDPRGFPLYAGVTAPVNVAVTVVA